MSDEPFDGAFDRGDVVLTDATDMAFVLLVGRDGVCDMRAGDGISRDQAAKWCREVAATLASGLTEIDGVTWCLAHDSWWLDGSTECEYRSSCESDIACIEAPLYRGEAITVPTEEEVT